MNLSPQVESLLKAHAELSAVNANLEAKLTALEGNLAEAQKDQPRERQMWINALAIILDNPADLNLIGSGSNGVRDALRPIAELRAKLSALDELRTIKGKRKWYHAGIVWQGDMGSFSIHKFLETFLATIDGGKPAPDVDERALAENATLRNQIQFFETAQETLIEQRDTLAAEVAELKAQLNTPELHDFSAGVVSEAQHQRARWGSDHDAGKEPHDWFWLLGYLAGKALKAATSGDTEKAKHHTISSAACLANWHAAMLGKTNMRPGIDPAERGIPAGGQ